MNMLITPAGPDDRARLHALFQLYVYDFSEMLGFDVDEDGHFHSPALDRYWSDSRCHPFLVRADEKLAGFALVQQGSRLTSDESVRDMDQFFVMRKYRRHGIGARAAGWLFDRFRGRWEVREKRENVVGAAFWRRVIARYTNGQFKDVVHDDEVWRGPVQYFDSSAVTGATPPAT
jgi:predicted acetyltransferase